MIKPISFSELENCTTVIRDSFGTVAKEFGLTEQNCSTNGAFIKVCRLENDFNRGCHMYGYYFDGKTVGFVQLVKKDVTSFELEKLAVLPEHRHKGFGKQLIDFCKTKVNEFGGNKITIGIIEENIRLKDWYLSYGFIHTGIRKFEHMPFTVGFMEIDV